MFYVFHKTIKLVRKTQILILLLHLSMLQMPIFILVFLHPPCKIMVMLLLLDRKMVTYREDPRDKKLVQGQEKKERQLVCLYFEKIDWCTEEVLSGVSILRK